MTPVVSFLSEPENDFTTRYVVDSISAIWLPFDLIRVSRQILNFWWHACCIYWLKKLQFLEDSRKNRMSRTRNVSRIQENDIFSEYFYWPIWKNLFSTSYGFTWICLRNWWERNVDLNVANISYIGILYLWDFYGWIPAMCIKLILRIFYIRIIDTIIDFKKKIIFSQSNNSLKYKMWKMWT